MTNTIEHINTLLAKAGEHADAVFADYLAHRVLERIAEGRSFDCDEYRALADLARGPVAAPFVDVAWVDDNDGRGPCKLSNSIRCF